VSATLSWAQSGRFQSSPRFTSTFRIFNNLGTLLLSSKATQVGSLPEVLSGFATVRLGSVQLMPLMAFPDMPPNHRVIRKATLAVV
jgi:hypothetical protein